MNIKSCSPIESGFQTMKQGCMPCLQSSLWDSSHFGTTPFGAPAGHGISGRWSTLLFPRAHRQPGSHMHPSPRSSCLRLGSRNVNCREHTSIFFPVCAEVFPSISSFRNVMSGISCRGYSGWSLSCCSLRNWLVVKTAGTLCVLHQLLSQDYPWQPADLLSVGGAPAQSC
jgi:hypothetical protein